MDPNEALERLRRAVAELKTEAQWRHEAALGDVVTEMVEKFEALDEWLSKGGFLPTAWKGVS